MPDPKSINELLRHGGGKLRDLQSRSQARQTVLEQVRVLLPEPLAASLVSAGLDGECLALGVTSAAWATRLRYQSETLRDELGRVLGTQLREIKVRVVPTGSPS